MSSPSQSSVSGGSKKDTHSKTPQTPPTKQRPAACVQPDEAVPSWPVIPAVKEINQPLKE